MRLFSQAGYIATFFKPRVYCPNYRAVQLVFHPEFRFYTRSARGQRRQIANYYLDKHFKKSVDVLPCQPRVTATPCFAHKATSDLESIYHIIDMQHDHILKKVILPGSEVKANATLICDTPPPQDASNDIGHYYSRNKARGQGKCHSNRLYDTPPSQDASRHHIWDSYLK